MSNAPGGISLSEPASRILQEALRLSPEERVDLADLLAFSLEPEYLLRVQEAQMRIVEARIDAFERGEIEAIPAEQALAEIRKKLGLPSKKARRVRKAASRAPRPEPERKRI